MLINITLKWMDNLQQIEDHQRTCHLFFILLRKKILSLTLFKIITLSRPRILLSTHPPYGEGGETLLQAKNVEFPASAGYILHQKNELPYPSPDHSHIQEKRCFHNLFEELRGKIVSSRIISQNKLGIPLLTKNVPSFDVALFPPPGVDCAPYSPTFERNPEDGVRIPLNKAKQYLFPRPEKLSIINLHPPLSKVSLLPHQITIFM